MYKTKQLNELFAKWNKKLKDSANSELFNNVFVNDGIVDCDVFEKQNIKLLFISNEANIDASFVPGSVYDIREDFIQYYERQKDEYRNDKSEVWESSKGKMRERVCCLYQVVTGDFSNINAPYRVARSFAFLNLNKTGGGSNINDRILAFCDEFKDEIKSEIDIISPDIIVWLGCNTLDNEKIRRNLCVTEKNGSYFYNSIPVIRMWHTAYYRSNYGRLGKFDNATIDKLSKKLYDELNAIGWYGANKPI